jgi:peptidoglycan hydrolase CwlO-like protein
MKQLLALLLMFLPTQVLAETPDKFVADYSGISWWIIVCLIGFVLGLLRLVWWLAIKAFEEMKTTNHDTIEELKTSNKEQLVELKETNTKQMDKLERSIDKLDNTIGKAFSRMDDFHDELELTNRNVAATKAEVGIIKEICKERRKYPRDNKVVNECN